MLAFLTQKLPAIDDAFAKVHPSAIVAGTLQQFRMMVTRSIEDATPQTLVGLWCSLSDTVGSRCSFFLFSLSFLTTAVDA